MSSPEIYDAIANPPDCCTATGGGTGVSMLFIDASLAGLIKLSANAGTIVASQSDDSPLNYQRRSVGGIGNLTVEQLLGVPIEKLGSTDFPALVHGINNNVQVPPQTTGGTTALDTPIPVLFSIENSGAVSIDGSGTVSIKRPGSYLAKIQYNLSRDLFTSEVFFKLYLEREGVIISDVATVSVDMPAVPQTFIDFHALEVPDLPDESTWTDISGDLTAPPTHIVADAAGILYVSRANDTSPTVSRSGDGGTTWTAFDNGMPAVGSVHKLAIDSDGTLYAATSGSGIFKRLQGAAAWVVDNIGIDSEACFSVFVDESSGFVYAGTNTSGIFRRPFFGTQWVAVNLGILSVSSLRFNEIIRDQNTLYAIASGGGSDGGVYSATPDDLTTGVGWTQSFPSPANINFFALTGNQQGTLYISGNNGVSGVSPTYVSTDAGTTWNLSNTGLGLSGEETKSLKAIPFTQKVYMGFDAVANGSAIWKSFDSGANWSISTITGTALDGFFLAPTATAGQFILYGAGIGDIKVHKLNIGSESVNFRFMWYLESDNGGENDGFLTTSLSSAPGVPNTASASLIVSRITPFVDS